MDCCFIAFFGFAINGPLRGTRLWGGQEKKRTFVPHLEMRPFQASLGTFLLIIHQSSLFPLQNTGRRLLAPEFNVAQTVTLGTPLMFHWRSTDGQDGRDNDFRVTENGKSGTGSFVSKTGQDWVGLYRAGECANTPNNQVIHSQRIHARADGV